MNFKLRKSNIRKGNFLQISEKFWSDKQFLALESRGSKPLDSALISKRKYFSEINNHGKYTQHDNTSDEGQQRI